MYAFFSIVLVILKKKRNTWVDNRFPKDNTDTFIIFLLKQYVYVMMVFFIALNFIYNFHPYISSLWNLNRNTKKHISKRLYGNCISTIHAQWHSLQVVIYKTNLLDQCVKFR